MAKAVRIGHARMDENGKICNGVAGDGTGKEVCITDFYPHSKGWNVLRAKDPAIAEKIAKCMEDACANNNIGYDQYGRLSLYNNVKNLKFKCDINTLKVKVECDCSSLVRVCLAYAGVMVSDFSTANEKDVILKTGMFELLECKANGANLKRGDILVTKTKGHTVVVLNDGADYQKVETKPTTPTVAPTSSFTLGQKVKLNKGAKYTSGKTPQSWVYNKELYVRDIDGDKIVVSTLASGAVTGEVYAKDLTPIKVSTTQSTPTTQVKNDTTKVESAKKKDSKLKGTYKTTSDLHLRAGAGKSKKSIIIMPKGTVVHNYGYYNEYDGTKWLLIQCTIKGVKYTGYSSSKYLDKQ